MLSHLSRRSPLDLPNRRRWLRPLAALALLALLVGAQASPSAAGPVDDETAFVTMINELRVAHGVAPLIVDDELTAQARHWTEMMAGGNDLRHTDDLSVGVTVAWDLLGENVGTHTVGDLDALFQAFVASPPHLDNLLDPRFERLGVGVSHTASGQLWTTHRFLSVPDPS
jgi:uncharacterized protein YkwD